VVHPPDPHSTEENQSHCFCDIPRLLPTNNLKEPTRPKAEKLGAQSVKSVMCYSKNLGAQGTVLGTTGYRAPVRQEGYNFPECC